MIAPDLYFMFVAPLIMGAFGLAIYVMAIRDVGKS